MISSETQETLIKRATIIAEAMPYFSKYAGKVVVIKYGGNAMLDDRVQQTIMQDVAALKIAGVHPVLVHGGGPDINSELEKAGIKSTFKNGLRVTSKEAMDVVQATLSGKLNKNIVSMLNKAGVKAVGICGKDGGLIEAERLEEYGYVGEIEKINTTVLEALLTDFVPVVATVGNGKNGESLNINADIAAGAIGGAMHAEKLLFLTDIDGIRKNEKDAESLIKRVSVKEINALVKSGTISGGMLPKVEACVSALKNGVKEIIITLGTIPHAILLELFTVDGIGTMVTK